MSMRAEDTPRPSPGADFDIEEPLVTPGAARGYLVMSGQAVESQDQLRLQEVNPFSLTAYAIHLSSKAQLFSATFLNLVDREAITPSTDGVEVGTRRPESWPRLSLPSNTLLKRFGQALVDAYTLKQDAVAEA